MTSDIIALYRLLQSDAAAAGGRGSGCGSVLNGSDDDAGGGWSADAEDCPAGGAVVSKAAPVVGSGVASVR